MDNPFELPAPSHPLERIHTFARDLAYGALLSYWRPGLTTAYYGDGSMEFMLHPPYNEAEVEKFTSKWSEDRRPNFETLRSFNYLSTESTICGAACLYDYASGIQTAGTTVSAAICVHLL